MSDSKHHHHDHSHNGHVYHSHETHSHIDEQVSTSFKLICTTILFIITLVSCYGPHLIRFLLSSVTRHTLPSCPSTEDLAGWMDARKRSSRKMRMIMAYLFCFAGGSVLGAALMSEGHAHHHGHGNSSSTHDHKYQWGSLCAGLCFLLLLAIDRLFLAKAHNEAQHGGKQNEEKDESHGHGHHHHHDRSCNHEHHNRNLGQASPTGDRPALNDSVRRVSTILTQNSSSNLLSSSWNDFSNQGLPQSSPSPSPSPPAHEQVPFHSHKGGHVHQHSHNSSSDMVKHVLDVESIALCSGGGCQVDGIQSTARKGVLQTLVFVTALSVHSIVEGLGMATKNTKSSLRPFLFSLFAHKWIEAFALGASVMAAGTAFSPLFAFLISLAYSAFTPLGILIGMSIDWYLKKHSTVSSGSVSSSTSALVEELFNGAAKGSFIFVACVEMIPPQFGHGMPVDKHSYGRFMVVIIGFLLMTFVASFHSDEENTI